MTDLRKGKRIRDHGKVKSFQFQPAFDLFVAFSEVLSFLDVIPSQRLV